MYSTTFRPVDPVQKNGQPGTNGNKNEVWFFLQLYIRNLTKKSPKSKDADRKS